MSNSKYDVANKIRKLRIAWQRREKRLSTKIKQNRIFHTNTMLRAIFAHIKRDSIYYVREGNQRIPEDKIERFINRIRSELKETKHLMDLLDLEFLNLKQHKLALGTAVEQELGKILSYAKNKNYENSDLSTSQDSEQSEEETSL